MDASPDPILLVSQRLDGFLKARTEDAVESGPDGVAFAEAAVAAVGGGKRLRAAFCVWGWRSVAELSGPVSALPDAVVAAAASLEVFQAAALVHDDIIDNSDTRRGAPSAHRRLEALHRGRGWSGDAAAHGRSAAILLGDLLVAWSDDLLEDGLGGAPREAATSARREYARMRQDVTIGQYLDIAAESAFVEASPDERLPRALHVASFKSARYSVQQPLLLGAALAGADDAQRDALSAFGHDVGMAFQLRDDVLGVFGDAAVTGKPSGDDLREGKRTALIALTAESLSAPAGRTFEELLGDRELGDAQVRMMQDTIRDAGALDRVEELISRYSRSADRALAGAPLANSAVGALRDLARRAVERTA